MATIRKRSGKTGISYQVIVRIRGFPPQYASFKRLTDAKRWGKQTESAILEGRYFKSAEARKHTFGELADRFITDTLPKKHATAQKIQTAQMQWWKERLGHYVLADIAPARIVECRDDLLNGTTRRGKPRTPATTNRYLACLSHAFTVAVNEWGWMEDNPMRKVKKPTEPRGRVRFLSQGQGEELDRLTQACSESDNPYLFTAFMMALSTGMRQAELMNLTWADVDLNQGRVILHETKNGERRSVPLTGKALHLLREHSKVRRLDTHLLFPGMKPDKPIDLRKAWQAALKKAGIADFHWHDLRHCTASYLAMNGASLAEISEVLGHKTLQMVKRYAHLSEAHTADVVGRMTEKVFGGG